MLKRCSLSLSMCLDVSVVVQFYGVSCGASTPDQNLYSMLLSFNVLQAVF